MGYIWSTTPFCITCTVNVVFRCVSRISTLSSMFIQWKDLHVRIDLVLDVHPVERPARAYRNTSRAPRGRCLDSHVQVFPLDEHLGQGRYPIRIIISCLVILRY